MEMRKYKKVIMWALGSILVGIAGCSTLTSYSPGYVSRVLIKQASDFDDYKWRNTIRIDAPKHVYALSEAPRPEMVAAAFEGAKRISSLDAFMQEANSSSLLVMKDGELIYEKYYNGYDAASFQAVASVSKALGSIALGRAIETGKISSIDDPITKYVPELLSKDKRFANITLAHLVDLRSGMDYNFDANFPFVNSYEARIYYADDLQRTLLSRAKVAEAPGNFLYSNISPNLLGMALESVGVNGAGWLEHDILKPVGAEYGALWATDHKGFPHYEEGVVMRARDMARVGQMMQSGGRAQGKLVISDNWHKRSTQALNTENSKIHNGRQMHFRNGWWQIVKADGPNDYSAIGHLGQYIYVSPQNGIVIVRTGPKLGGLIHEDWMEIFFTAANRL